ncbi:hypothetical protein QTJ16_004721 [Diplocarpon rosae]|uniref:Altered inheritance of mitochondria protein 11 n=1 Tax=Diplocarpon rosae TaxID=946125 RepID=A0AAD9SYF3_9HELO|nr:hypothetical protein QTJ16_004721 [Diplocarpon rosae]PBP18810.1 hypothetical protein BUE80_DR010494 [Diplocarpon rosae]
MTEPPSTSAPLTSKPVEPDSSFFSQRSRRQLGLFAAGAGFFLLSAAVTRRSIIRRHRAFVPKFYEPSNRVAPEVNGAVEAAEALAIATINVASVGIMSTGGLLWAFDISSLDDLKRRVRRNMGVSIERTDQDAEEEIEEWFATVLSRKEFKILRGDHSIKDQDLETIKKRNEERVKKHEGDEKKTKDSDTKS